MGAWIEIPRKSETTPNKDVAPLVGAWIEMTIPPRIRLPELSLLSWERGLKSLTDNDKVAAPESLLSWERGLKFSQFGGGCERNCRSSRGSVD